MLVVVAAMNPTAHDEQNLVELQIVFEMFGDLGGFIKSPVHAHSFFLRAVFAHARPRMSEDSTKEERVRVNWTFDEAAQVAEHLKNDLKLDKVLFIMGGWIHRGYDNQHPDILPSAPECGGEIGRASCR